MDIGAVVRFREREWVVLGVAGRRGALRSAGYLAAFIDGQPRQIAGFSRRQGGDVTLVLRKAKPQRVTFQGKLVIVDLLPYRPGPAHPQREKFAPMVCDEEVERSAR